MNNNIVNNCLLGHYYYKYMVGFIVILLLTYELYNALIKTHVIFKNKNGKKKLHVFFAKTSSFRASCIDMEATYS